MKKQKVDYIIFGENDSIIATGVCFARVGEWQMQDICDDAGVDMGDVWSMQTTDA